MIRGTLKRQCADSKTFILVNGLEKFNETFGYVLLNEEMKEANQRYIVRMTRYISTYGITKYRDAFEPSENVLILLEDVHKNEANTIFLNMNQ